MTIIHKTGLWRCGLLLLSAAVLLLSAAPARPQGQQAEAEAFEDTTSIMFLGEQLYEVSIASRKAEPLRRAPAAVTVIKQEQLVKYRTLADVLRTIPGFFVDRNELKERIYLRGVPDSFLVMMDGVPFSSDASTIDYPRGMELSLDYIEKIEIIRGPGSALWGPDAFSGIVNLVTKKAQDYTGVALRGETGSYDTRLGSVQAGWSHKGWDAYMFGSVASSEGFESDLPGDEKRHDDRYGEIYAKLSYRDVFELSGRYSRYRDYYSDPHFMLEGSEHKSFSFVQATLNKSFTNSALFVQGWFQYFDSLDDYDRSRYEQFNRQYGLEVKYDHSLWNNHFVTLGVSFRYNDGTETTFKYNDQDFEYFPSYTTNLTSLYIQDKWKILENLELTAGVRYDYHDEYKNFTSPRVGINYIFLKYFNIKLLYGRAFRTPSLAVVIEESSLDPEQIDSYEVELGFNYKNRLSLEVNYFYNEFDNLIERDALGDISNRGDDIIKGVEVSLRWAPLSWLSLYGNYSHLFGNRQRGTEATRLVPSEQEPGETTETTVESFLNVAPDNIINAGIELGPWRRFRLTLDMNYVDRRKLAQGLEEFSNGRRHLSSYVLFDLNLFVDDFPFDNARLRFTVKNLTDKEYFTRGVFGLVEGEGSSMYLTLSYRY